MLYRILRSLAVLIFKVLFCFQSKGVEYIPKKGGFILASNHLSYLDPIALGIACPRKLNFIARHDLFHNPVFSWLLNNLGTFPIKRDSADLPAIREAMRRLKDGGPIVLFPEGTRGIGGSSQEPYAGIGFLAVKLGVPVVPAVVSGTDKALPKGAKFIRLNRVSVRFGKQIHVDGKKPYEEIARSIMEKIRRIS